VSPNQGTIEFAGILYLPGMAPFDQQQAQLKSRSIKLYVKRVFISDEFDDDLMPRYLNFVKVRGGEAIVECHSFPATADHAFTSSHTNIDTEPVI
jgi:HSP90 family molecular chaperone